MMNSRPLTGVPAPLVTLSALLAALPLSGCLRIQEPLALSDRDAGGPIGGRNGAPIDPGEPSPGEGGGGASEGVAGAPWGDDVGMPPVGGGGPGNGSGGGGGVAGGDEPPVAMGAGGAGGAAGGSCDCDDGDACTVDSCDAEGGCVHESIATMTDDDDDGVSSGCDCDDEDPDVSPEQTEFFAEPRGGSGGSMTRFDYDCDGYELPLLNNVAHGCRLYEGLDACYGEGWLSDDRRTVPGCGSGGAYQICTFEDGACTPQVLMMIQRCR